MRTSPFVLAAALVALAGCFEPVEVSSPGTEPDAASTTCRTDQDCPAPAPSGCTVNVIHCIAGTCVPLQEKPFWDADPGACHTAFDCGCQSKLQHGGCNGDWTCEAGRCNWACTGAGCTKDSECAAGTVCEPGTGCTAPNSCVAGCHDDTQCKQGEVCTKKVCKTCPCAGTCEPAATGCKSDTECPQGQVCEPTGDCSKGPFQCVPGCHDSTQCGKGQSCSVPRCVTCPCPGTCSGQTPCSSDADCGAGTICGEDQKCGKACVPGCRTDAQCGTGYRCNQMVCNACGCNPQCVPQTTGCKVDTDCPMGSVCDTPGCGPATCVQGCHTSSQCGSNQVCDLSACGNCACYGTCRSTPTGCTTDKDCPQGTVCEFGTGCTGTKSCVRGCHNSTQCGSGQVCDTSQTCLTCPCPGSCTQPPDPCFDADGDGFIAACTKQLCPGKKGACDCDDTNPKVFPGQVEICGNKVDDNCSGQVDEGCTSGCGPGSNACKSTLYDCSLGSTYCNNLCCMQCPAYVPPPCPMGACMEPGGIDVNGCQQPPTCTKCCACPAVYAPVCGTNYATYQSECEATCAGVKVLHTGACMKGEGLRCNSDPECGAGMYCRDTCPVCGAIQTMRCTQIAACTAAWDCPAGLSTPRCMNGVGSWACNKSQCEYKCP